MRKTIQYTEYHRDQLEFLYQRQQLKARHSVKDNGCRYILSLLLFSAFALGACGEDERSEGEVIFEDAGEGVSGEGRDQTSGDQAGEERSAGDDRIWATKPPPGGESSGGDEAESVADDEWINIELDGLGLITPVDGDREELPLGESICAYQRPNFILEHPFTSMSRGLDERRAQWRGDTESAYHLEVASISHLSPIKELSDQDRHSLEALKERSEWSDKIDGVVLPTHVNTLPLFERAQPWESARCYELGPFDAQTGLAEQGGTLLSESDAYTMYSRLVQSTLWRVIDQSPNHRTIIGIRGAYPGSLLWHYNAPNQYNDTLILLWRDESGVPHVREYPVNTDTGVYDFGVDSSSSLRANRHYPYINGWHRDYNAIQIALPAYPVRDDTNNNGHWDSDRNGWLEGPESGDDYDRLGTAHNIHAGDSNGPLGEALINIASAGCQVIPGMENWLSFIGDAWTGLGDELDYYLIDARDISPRFWSSCESADGSHACPHLIERFPYIHQGDTSSSIERRYAEYNCSDADESGPEQVYVMNLPRSGYIRATITTDHDEIDPDLYLLEGDDFNACRVRDHRRVDSWLPAGRYVLIVDTWVNDEGRELSGPYTLSVNWSPED